MCCLRFSYLKLWTESSQTGCLEQLGSVIKGMMEKQVGELSYGDRSSQMTTVTWRVGVVRGPGILHMSVWFSYP